jgi:hypothetical protein
MGSVDALSQMIRDAPLKLNDAIDYAGPAPKHQHCGRDIHKGQDRHQHYHQARGILWRLIANS